ncbi:O-antigen ligase family protein [Paraconexibacter antarcticus]|uniref:O-antigen ligase family protein n=1 Tax=Paraconexibacter antarcticus TaxID=2949664 RepID=A0ABY5DSN5_9ACTN|nr:O-antigen ligase family protein [Paraconexibacter antarcticus]UTI65028.1 O-antigen ligase family protein [Paraconexibacter antarcticus]
MSAPAYNAPPRSARRPPRVAAWPVATIGRPTPDLLFAGALALLLSAVTFEGGGGLSLGPTTRVEMGLQILGGLVGAAALLLTGARRLHGGLSLALFGVLTAVTIASIGWAVQPHDAWLESARTLAYLATFASGIALVRLAPQRWAAVLWAVLAATAIVSGYALLTKIFPAWLAPDETYARLREPFGYWNAIGLMAALGVPGCLWLGARRTGHAAVNALATPLLGLLLVVVLLAYSRGSILAALVGAGFWFLVVPLRLRGVAVLTPALLGAAVVSGWAFQKDALSKDRVPLDLRTTAGHEFGVALVMLVLVLGAAALAIGFFRSRQAPTLLARRRFAIVCFVVLALVPVAFAAKLAGSQRGLGGSISHTWTQLTDPNAVTPANDPGRLTAVGSVRATYFDQAIKIYKARPLYGAGAGGFATARQRFRKDGYEVRHAHGYLFQTAADLGLLGLLASFALMIAWFVTAARTTGLTPARWRQEPFGPERVGLLTLTSIVLVFGVHSAVDWTWFVPGDAVVALLCAGWVAGRGDHRLALVGDGVAGAGAAQAPWRERLQAGLRSRVAAGAAAATVVLALAFAWSTWQPLRSVAAGNESLALLGQNKLDEARAAAVKAHDRDPLSIDPLLDLSAVESAAKNPTAARAALERAVNLQPQNATSWLTLAEFDLAHGGAHQALKELGPALYLDPRSTEGVTLFLEASRQAPAPAATGASTAKKSSAAATP